VRLYLYAIAAAFAAAVSLEGAQAAKPPVPPFQHALVIVFENKAKPKVIGSPDAPYFNSLASKYAILSRYGGVAHPSLPNYLALISGSTHGITETCTTCIVAARNLADTLPPAGRAWKTYAEGLPRAGWTGAAKGRYAKKHVPFLYFRSVVSRPTRLKRVVPLRSFGRDLAADRLPDFALIVPDLCHDMHDCPVATGDAWLSRFLPPLLRSQRLARSVIFVIFDEGPKSNAPTDLLPALAVGRLVKPGSEYSPKTSHYGLLRTIEDAWGLPRLGRSKRVGPITGIWKGSMPSG
jgi:phosphatidylinositol-3-phosphatase